MSASSTMKTTIITSDIDFEVAFGALGSFLFSDATIISKRYDDLRKPGFLDEFNRPGRLICFGDFISPDQDALLKANKDYVNIKFDNGRPFSELTDIVLKNDPSRMTKFAILSNAKLITILDDRVCNKNMHETQGFATGVYNMDESLSIFERFMLILDGTFNVDYIASEGSKILSSQITLCKQRAIKNSKTGTLRNGEKYCVTNGSELIVISHQELKKHHPDVDVTIVTKLLFSDSKEDLVHHSLRSWNEDVSAKNILKSRGDGTQSDRAGGSETSAGGAVPVDVKIDY